MNKSIIIGKDTEDYALKILDLLRTPEKADNLAYRGHEFVKRSYNWSRSNQLLETIMNK